MHLDHLLSLRSEQSRHNCTFKREERWSFPKPWASHHTNDIKRTAIVMETAIYSCAGTRSKS
jgi:hypothetical protein